jgi:hypothetical protein
MVEVIDHLGIVIAIIVRKDHRKEGIEFLTPNSYSLQLGHMTRPVGYEVIPHTHNPVRRETYGTQEALFVKSGVIRIDFYSFEREYLESRELAEGDIILLAGAGHGIKVLEAATIVEVKNGPFIEGADKGRFEGRKG